MVLAVKSAHHISGRILKALPSTCGCQMYSGDTKGQLLCQKLQVQQNVFQMSKEADEREEICKRCDIEEDLKQGRQRYFRTEPGVQPNIQMTYHLSSVEICGTSLRPECQRRMAHKMQK